jgi:hypothetical protein
MFTSPFTGDAICNDWVEEFSARYLHYHCCHMVLSIMPLSLITWLSTIIKTFLFSPVILFVYISVSRHSIDHNTHIYIINYNYFSSLFIWYSNLNKFIHKPVIFQKFRFLIFLKSQLFSKTEAIIPWSGVTEQTLNKACLLHFPDSYLCHLNYIDISYSTTEGPFINPCKIFIF